MRGISVRDERRLYMRAVIAGQLPETYITDKELHLIYDNLWKEMISSLLPQQSCSLSYN
jgi:hypothetical protein